MADDNTFPSWVPQVAPGVHADVYPVSPTSLQRATHPNPPAELRLDRLAVTQGYAERRLPYEFDSRLPSAAALDRPSRAAAAAAAAASASASASAAAAAAAASSSSDAAPGGSPTTTLTSAHLAKLRDGLTTLRRARPTNLQRHLIHTFAPPPPDAAPDPPKKAFPLQKASAASSLDDWFNKLTSPPAPAPGAPNPAAGPASSASASATTTDNHHHHHHHHTHHQHHHHHHHHHAHKHGSTPGAQGVSSSTSASSAATAPNGSSASSSASSTSNAWPTTAVLARNVPLGPAIVRAAGKVIEMMATRGVPAQRAAWYVRIAVLNECVKHTRPDRPPPSPRVFWTRQLGALLRTEIEAIRARRTAVLGSMDRVAFWRYVIDLARWQADEGLLDLLPWLRAVADVLRNELANAQTLTAPGTDIAVMAARRFLPEFVADPDTARLLCEALLPSATLVIRAWKAAASGRDMKANKALQRKSTKRPFQANTCHREITVLLGAALRALDSTAVQDTPALRFTDLERYVKKASEILQSAKEAKKAAKEPAKLADLQTSDKAKQHPAPLHFAMRECEMLPSHGDVSRVAAAVHAVSAAGDGTMQAAVNMICQWVIDGPDRAEAISIGAAVLSHISKSIRVTVASANTNAAATTTPPNPAKPKPAPRPTPITKRGKKSLHHPRPSQQAPATSGTTVTASDADPPLQRELWVFFKDLSTKREKQTAEILEEKKEHKTNDEKEADPPENDNFLVRFLAQLCRLEVISLPAFVRNVSRLTSCGHPGSSYLVKCLSMLPDPVDKSISDCRRSLLRKFGYLSNAKTNYSHGVDEKAVKAATSGELSAMENEADNLVNDGNTNVILSTSEAVRLENISQLSGDSETIANKLYSITSFLLLVDEPGMVVEWLLDNLGDAVEGTNDLASDANMQKRRHMLTLLTRISLDVARYVAACGQLENVFLMLRKAYQCGWISSFIREQILHTLAAMTCIFGKGSESGSGYWTKMCVSHLKSLAETSVSPNMVGFAVACIRGRADVRSDEKSIAECLDLSNRENWGLTPDEDLQITAQRAMCRGLSLAEQRESLCNSEYFPIQSLLNKGLCANDIFGGIFIPVLTESLNEAQPGEPPVMPFSTIAIKILQVIECRQNDVRMHGLSTTLIIEFVAVVIAGCFCSQGEAESQPPEALEILVQLRWMWRILTSRAGIKLSRRLRGRVDHYCEKTTVTDKSELSATLFNMMIRAWGETSRDELLISSAIGAEPFGMVEMQLALLAVHRRDTGEDELFASNVTDSVVHFVDRESAYSLTCTALQCCAFEDEYRQSVASIIAYSAVDVMRESLEYVVAGLTVDSTKNTTVHQERANQWYEADTARRTVLENSVDYLSDENGVQVEALLYEQIASATTQLSNAQSKGFLPSSLLNTGEQISQALESRLCCILRSRRTAQSAEVWRERAIQIAQLLQSGAPMLKRSTIQICLRLINMCLRNVGDCGRASDDKSSSNVSVTQILDRNQNREVKKQLQLCLTPTLYWTESPERDTILSLVGKGTRGAKVKANTVRALNEKGTDIDNWLLLEGYGRGADEDCSVSPSMFWIQGEHTRYAEPKPSVQLKRTYSTYASLVS